MSDPIIQEPVEPSNEPEPKAPEEGLTVEELAAQLEQIKKAQAGSDKAYQETAKRLKEVEAEKDRLKKANMDEKERADFEREEKERELAERESEINKATLRLSLVEALGAAEMEIDFADFVPGNTKEEVIENIGKLKELVNTEVGKRVTQTLNSTTKPTAGETPAGKGAVDPKGKSFQELERLVRERKL